jgi:hypothetical protein
MFYSKPSVPPRGGSTLGYYYAALSGSIDARKLIGKFQSGSFLKLWDTCGKGSHL